MRSLSLLCLVATASALSLIAVVQAQPRTVAIAFDTGSEGKGIGAGDVDPDFTWNLTGDFGDPRYTTRIFNRQGRSLWLGYEKRCTCAMADGACWKNEYAPDVPSSEPPYDGVEYYFFTFPLPSTGTDAVLSVDGLTADDRVVLLLNGTEIGGFSSRVSSPTIGSMESGDGSVTTHTFRPAPQYAAVSDPTLFVAGGPNVLTFWVNNTGSLDLSARAGPHGSIVDVSLLNAHGTIRYREEAKPPTAAATATRTRQPTPGATKLPSATPSAKPTDPAPTDPAPTPCVCAFLRGKVPPAVISHAVANPASYYGWQVPMNPNIPVGPMNPRRACLSLQNPNTRFHPIWNAPVWRVDCP